MVKGNTEFDVFYNLHNKTKYQESLSIKLIKDIYIQLLNS